MTNKVYDVLKTISLIVTPLGVFVVSLLGIWTTIDTTPITATIAAIEVFLGSLLTISSKGFWSNSHGI